MPLCCHCKQEQGSYSNLFKHEAQCSSKPSRTLTITEQKNEIDDKEFIEMQRLLTMNDLIVALDSSFATIGCNQDEYSCKRTIFPNSASIAQGSNNMTSLIFRGSVTSWDKVRKFVNEFAKEKQFSFSNSKGILVYPTFWSLSEIKQYISMMFRLGTDRITTVNACVASAYHFVGKNPAIIIDLQGDITSCATVRNGKAVKWDLIPVGISDICTSLSIQDQENDQMIQQLQAACPTGFAEGTAFEILFQKGEKNVISMLTSQIESLEMVEDRFTILFAGRAKCEAIRRLIQRELSKISSHYIVCKEGDDEAYKGAYMLSTRMNVTKDFVTKKTYLQNTNTCVKQLYDQHTAPPPKREPHKLPKLDPRILKAGKPATVK